MYLKKRKTAEPQPEEPKDNPFEGLSPEQIQDWQNFEAWIKKNDYKRVQSLGKPLMPVQLARLLNNKKYNVDLIKKTYIAMENWKPLTSKSVSAYDTLRVWMDKYIKNEAA